MGLRLAETHSEYDAATHLKPNSEVVTSSTRLGVAKRSAQEPCSAPVTHLANADFHNRTYEALHFSISRQTGASSRSEHHPIYPATSLVRVLLSTGPPDFVVQPVGHLQIHLVI